MNTSLGTKVKKSLSWRLHASLTTLIVSYLYTGTLKLAGGIALTLMTIKLFLYVYSEIGDFLRPQKLLRSFEYHEKLWELIGNGELL